MKEYQISFWNPAEFSHEKKIIFGCSSFGFSTSDKWISPGNSAITSWEHKLKGEVMTGSYLQVIQQLNDLDFKPELCMILLRKGEGAELKKIH